MANLIIVCGPQAVGKMTVAECLRDKLRYNLMVNHDSIEVSDRIFGFATPAQKEFNILFREKAFEVAVKHNIDLIFTCVIAFEMQEERDYLALLQEKFRMTGGDLYLVELSAELETRLARNETPHRMERKASKRDVVWSRVNLLLDADNHRLNSDADEVWFDHHLRIDNTFLEPEQAADRIIEAFQLEPREKSENEYRYGSGN